MPLPYQPMLCYPADAVPAGPDWVQEPKWDGFRTLAFRDASGRILLYSRRGHPFTGQFPYLETALTGLLPADTVLDGELVALRQHGPHVIQDRNLVQTAVASSGPHRPSATSPALHYVAFDVLRSAGADLCARPWEDRRAELEQLVGAGDAHVTITPTGPPDAGRHNRFLEQGFEGSLFKRCSSRYRPGKRSRDWLKLKLPL